MQMLHELFSCAMLFAARSVQQSYSDSMIVLTLWHCAQRQDFIQGSVSRSKLPPLMTMPTRRPARFSCPSTSAP